jgi:lipoate-protein ligase A
MSGFPLDEDLLERVPGSAPFSVRTWEPDRVAVVLGRGNSLEREVRQEACGTDGVPVLRRLGGGGAVVLSPGCVVVSLAKGWSASSTRATCSGRWP